MRLFAALAAQLVAVLRGSRPRLYNPRNPQPRAAAPAAPAARPIGCAARPPPLRSPPATRPRPSFISVLISPSPALRGCIHLRARNGRPRLVPVLERKRHAAIPSSMPPTIHTGITGAGRHIFVRQLRGCEPPPFLLQLLKDGSGLATANL